MKHIGILAHSADGAALCFLEIVRESARRLGPHRHPEITLSILPKGEVQEAYDRGDLAAVNAPLMRTCRRLADAGCDFYVCPANSEALADARVRRQRRMAAGEDQREQVIADRIVERRARAR